MNHVEVQGLRKTDLTKKRKDKIEKAITSAILQVIGKRFEKFYLEDLSFNFSHDLTVISENAPIVIKVEIVDDAPDFVKDKLARTIWVAFRGTVREWRKLDKVKVRVIFLPALFGYYFG